MEAQSQTNDLTLRNILIMTSGSRGDVQPYIALSVGLQNAGYNVAIMTNHDHKTFVEELGIKCLCAFASCDQVIKESQTIMDSMAKGDAMKFIAGLNEAMDTYKESQVRDFMKCIEEFKHDLLVEGSLSEYFGLIARYKLEIPTISLKLQGMIYNPKRMNMGLPSLPFGLHRYLLWKGLLGGMYDGFKSMDREFQKQHGFGVLDIVTKSMFVEEASKAPQQPHYILQSIEYKEKLYPCAHPNFKLIGQCIIPSDTQQKTKGSFGNTSEIEDFLAVGTKPIYCGWGSMTCKSSEHMVELVAKAVMHSNQRAIVLGGWAQLSMEGLRRATQDEALLAYVEKNVLFVEKAPHEWLFPQVACTVHHGGAGTLASATRAGVPTIVTPIFLDQWDHAHLVNDLGIGIGMKNQFQKTTAEELGNAIKQVVENQTFAANVKEVGAKLRAEDGVQAAVSSIESYWVDWIKSGKLSAQVERTIEASDQRGLCSCSAGFRPGKASS